MTIVSPEARFKWDIEAPIEIQKYPSMKNLLDASGILRRLLIDNECPLHKVARGRDFKAKFDIAGRLFADVIRGLPDIPQPTFSGITQIRT